MNDKVPADVVFAFSVYSAALWLVVLALLAVLYVYARPIVTLARTEAARRQPGTARRVCARSASFLAVFSLSPVTASVLGLPVGAVLLFVSAFIALRIILKRGVALWPVAVFLALIAVQAVLDISFFIVASEYADAFSGLADLLVFRGPADPENVAHVFLMLPADLALLFHITKTAMDLTALVPATLALRQARNG
jgi:hypothetical protein